MLDPIKPRAFKVNDDPPQREPSQAPFGLQRDGVQQSTGAALYTGRDGAIYRRRSGGGWDVWDESAQGDNGRLGAYTPIEPRAIRDRQAGLSSGAASQGESQEGGQGWMDAVGQFAQRGWQMYGQARQDIADAASAHQERIPGVSEIGYQAIPSDQEGVGGWLDSTRKGFATSGSRFLNSTDEAMLQQLMRHNPNLEIATDEQILPQLRASGQIPEDFEIPRREDEPPRIVVRHGPDGEWGYVNSPGLSTMEYQQMGIEAVKFLPITRLAGFLGSTALRRIGIAGASGVALENASEAAGEALQVGEYSPTRATVTGALAGAGGQAADEVITPLIRSGGNTVRQAMPEAVAPRPRQPEIPPVGQATPEAAQARAAAAQEQGIPLTRGQTTQRVSDLDVEARAARGSSGDRAAARINERLAEQRRAAEAAAQKIVAGGATESDDEAAGLVLESVRRMARESEEQVDAAWSGARAAAQADYDAGARVSASSGSRLRTLQDQAIRDARVEGGAVMSDQTPNASAVQRLFDDLADGIEAGELGLGDLDIVRKQIAVYRRQALASPERAMDQIVTMRLSRAYDDWLDNLLSQGAYSGDGAVLQQFRQARQFSRQHHEEFGINGQQDAAGRWVQSRLNVDADDATTLQGAFNARGMPTTQSQPIIRRLRGIYARRSGVKPDGSRRALAGNVPGFAALRETALRRGLQGLAPDGTAGAKFTPKSVVTRFGEWLNNGSFLRELFDPAEITQLKRLHKLMEQMVFDNALTNPSGTADALLRALGNTMGNFDSPMQALLRRMVGLAFDMGDQVTDASARQIGRNVGGPGGYRPAPGTGGSAAGYGSVISQADTLRRQGEQRRKR